ncbi:putative neuropeptide receptor [Schistosoma mansoni]|uniref:Putative neuropeptide receptor n=1 Tax=Schistosoma mansoni TaxID=6183 RepID=G4V636_SCHMA|nr:putative neuropeptide receptor [Schistosoma mansoni]|eukprot:XP_018648591.1 putative neuropeptide receptor [Schistosoma mansoni]
MEKHTYQKINYYSNIQQTNLTFDVAKEILPVKLIIIILYSFITLMGVTGNLLVVWIVLRVKLLQTITNIFIANLAISDILMSLVATPFTPLSLYMNNWTLPEAVCKLLPTTMGVSVYVSTLTSMAIALDRFFVIVHPFLPRMKVWLCLIIIFTVWIIAVLISMPLAVYQQKHKDPINNVSSCRENWPKESSREVFTIVSFVLQFVIPCSIISVCYFRISLLLRARLHTQIGSGTKTHIKEEREIKRKRRTNTMLIAMVIIFVICWIPLNILWMVMDVHSEEQINDVQNSKNFSLIFFICHLLAMSSAVYNPFLYAWMNSNFRKEFHRILPCFFLKSKFYTNQITTQTIGGEYTAVRINYFNSTIQPRSAILRASDEFKETSQCLSNELNLNQKQQQQNDKSNFDSQINHHNDNNNNSTIISYNEGTNKQYDHNQWTHRTEAAICHNQSNESLNKININLNDRIEMKNITDNNNNSNDDKVLEKIDYSQMIHP